MNLNERITMARKQSGLSQEQLGEKLGVSRQAVSKWETGQANPDVAYVAEMCRLFGVSSDWLLLGIEDSAPSGPERCPNCQHVVTGLDNFCPNCGFDLHGANPRFYNLVFNPVDRLDGRQDLQTLSTSSQVTFSADSPLSHPLSDDEISDLMASAPVVLARGLTQEKVLQILDIVSGESNFSVCPVQEGSTSDSPPPQLLRPAADLRKREPLSFGGMVLAVVVGIFVAMLIGSFL